MTKSLVVKLFWGSLLGLVAGLAAYVIAGPDGLKAKEELSALGKPGGAPQPVDGELARATAWDKR
jgi:hypothetical protein